MHSAYSGECYNLSFLAPIACSVMFDQNIWSRVLQMEQQKELIAIIDAFVFDELQTHEYPRDFALVHLPMYYLAEVNREPPFPSNACLFTYAQMENKVVLENET